MATISYIIITMIARYVSHLRRRTLLFLFLLASSVALVSGGALLDLVLTVYE